MLSIQYLFLFFIVDICRSFVLLDVSNSGVLSSNGDAIVNPYYRPSDEDGTSSALIDHMRRLYEQEKDTTSMNDYNVIRAIAPRLVEIGNVTMYVFDLNVIRRTERVVSVSLHFYKRRTRWPISYSLHEIYSAHRLSSLSAQIQLDAVTFGWQSFPIFDIVQRQLSYLTASEKSEYFGLTLKPSVTTATQRRHIISLDKFSVFTPFMVLYANDSMQSNIFEEFIPKNIEELVKPYTQFEETVNKSNRPKGTVRSKRFVPHRRMTFSSTSASPSTAALDALLPHRNASVSASSSDTCSVKPFVIDFADLGFASWIVEPRSYLANFCSGECDTKSMSNHALLKYLLQRLGVRSDIELPRACCTPSRYSSLTLFYKSSDYNYLIRHVSNLIVEACHCR